jgi:Domain of unknown function (DUF4170)
MFEVVGGVHTDLSFTKVADDTREKYGPFENYQDAFDTWKSKMWSNVDNALHRLRIVKMS